MGYVGTWGVPSIKGAAAHGPAAPSTSIYALPPMVGTEHKFVQNSGWAFAVPRTSKNQKVAWDIAQGAGAVAGGDAEVVGRHRRAAGAASATAPRRPLPAIPLLAKVQPLLEHGPVGGLHPGRGDRDRSRAPSVSNYFAVVNGQKTIDQALADMQKTANDAIWLPTSRQVGKRHCEPAADVVRAGALSVSFWAAPLGCDDAVAGRSDPRRSAAVVLRVPGRQQHQLRARAADGDRGGQPAGGVGGRPVRDAWPGTPAATPQGDRRRRSELLDGGRRGVHRPGQHRPGRPAEVAAGRTAP